MINTEFKDCIKALRKDNGLTQTEFGDRLAVSRSVVSNWEYGMVEPTDMAIRHICNTFHVREQWLRTGEGEMYEETAETVLDQLAAEYDLGPAGKMIVQAALKMYRIGGEKAFVDLVRDILPMMQDIVKQADVDKLRGALSGPGTDSARSGTE